MAITPDRKRVVSGSAHGILVMWDLKQGKKIAEFFCECRINFCSFAQETGTLIAADENNRIYIIRLLE